MVLPQPISPQTFLSQSELDRFAVLLGDAIEGYESRIAESPDYEDLSQAVYSRAHTEALAALARIENRTYGLCQECDGQIPVERLEALPHTATCTACSGLPKQH